MSATLIVHCIAARNLYDAGDLIGSQDPYLKLTLGSTKLKSSVHKNGGTQAQWNDTLTFQIPADPALAPTTLHVACWDKDTISSDDLIGLGEVNLPQALAATGAFDGWVELSRGEGGRRAAGQVHLHIRYIPSVASAAEGGSAATVATAAAVVGGGAVAAVLAHKMDKKKRKKKKKHGKWHGSGSSGGENGGDGGEYEGDSGSSSDGGEWEGGDDGGEEESGVGGLIGGIFGAIFGDD